MSFHVRILKHNLIKLSRLRAVAYTTEICDKTTQNEQLPKHVKPWHAYTTHDNLPALIDGVACRSSSNILAQPLAATQSLPGLYENSQDKVTLPQLKSDLESLLLGSECGTESADTGCLMDYVKPVSYTTDDILTPSHLVNSLDYATLSDTIITQENISVTFLHLSDNQNFLAQHGLSLTSKYQPEGSKDHVMICSSDNSNETKGSNPPGDLPTAQQLHNMKELLINEVPKFFKEQTEYRLYHPKLVFENNFWGKNKVYQGVGQYAVQILKFRALAHLQYAQVGATVISASSQPETGTIHLRWRVTGLPQVKALFFWKYTPWTYRENIKKDSHRHDGISIFTLKSDGLIHKHRMDRVMVDEERQEVKEPSLATKLATLCVGLLPEAGLEDLGSMFMKDPK